MATFNDMLVTNAGKIIYAKAMSGKQLVFSSVKFGSGSPASQSAVEGLTDLLQPLISGSIESIDTTTLTGVAILTVQVNNATLEDSIGIKEIGVFCKEPDTGNNVMYAYCYSPNDIDVIPSNENGSIIWKMRIQLAISNVSTTATNPQQTAFIAFTPTVKATAADGATVFVSSISADCKYIIKGSLITALYSITGKLTNMASAASGLSSLTISLPRQSNSKCSISAPMTVTNTSGEKILVDVSGEIVSGGGNIDIDYFGAQDGNFSLNMTVIYSV